MSVRLAQFAREEQAAAIARCAVGGLLHLVAGDAQPDPSTPADPERVVASLPIATSAVRVSGTGAVSFGPIEGRVTRVGTVRWLQVVDSHGRPILDATVAVEGSRGRVKADCYLTRCDLMAGDVVTITEATLESKAS